jgi:hypothetical protein
MGTSKNLLRILIAALGGARNPHPDLSGLRFLPSIRLALRSLMTLFRGTLMKGSSGHFNHQNTGLLNALTVRMLEKAPFPKTGPA